MNDHAQSMYYLIHIKFKKFKCRKVTTSLKVLTKAVEMQGLRACRQRFQCARRLVMRQNPTALETR